MENVEFAQPPVFTGEWGRILPGRNDPQDSTLLIEAEVTFSETVSLSWLKVFISVAEECGLALSGDRPEEPKARIRLWVRADGVEAAAKGLWKSLKGANKQGGDAAGVIREAQSTVDGLWPK